ncbi:MAG: class I SAM-dependent methyltransferase [Actinomycetota bacterium]
MSDLFERWSRTYDDAALQRLTYRTLHDAVVSVASAQRPGIILDVGCGTGQLTRRLTQLDWAPTVYGLDMSTGMLDRARSSGAPLIRASAEALPIADHSIELITCTESFHWYTDQRGAAAELARTLRPDGQVVIISIATFTDVGASLLRRATARRSPIRALPPHRIRVLLKEAGLDVSEQRRLRRPTPPWPVLTLAQQSR